MIEAHLPILEIIFKEDSNIEDLIKLLLLWITPTSLRIFKDFGQKQKKPPKGWFRKINTSPPTILWNILCYLIP